MENKGRLIFSVVLLFVFWFMISLVSLYEGIGIVLSVLFLCGGIWSLIEGIVFVKRKENKNALPLALMAIFIAFYAIFMGIGAIVNSAFDLVEGGPFQVIGFLLFFIAMILFPILAIWAIINWIRSRGKR
jgi:hypothetical protein